MQSDIWPLQSTVLHIEGYIYIFMIVFYAGYLNFGTMVLENFLYAFHQFKCGGS